jgi:SAM-dependent methyltransferase
MATQTRDPSIADIWAAGEAYEPYVGRWSRPVAGEFLAWLDLPRGARWLDVGCGTGVLTQSILAHAAPREVLALDRSPGFVAYARAQVDDARASFGEGDAQALPVADGACDAAVSGLVLNFVAQPDTALREMKRVLRRGGVAAVYVWDYAGEMQLMRRFWDAAAAIDPAARALDEGVRFPLCKPEPLRALFAAAGFDSIESRAIDVPTVFRDFDDYWQPFLGGQGPAPGYCCALPADRRDALRERLRASLPVDADGRIRLVARAFAARGIKPN